ncbi:hypothetical protein H9P43_002320 [Blastocladiella emersonii ATCC 22665]|nr:hypothetical protein H9P43_002320 [Blastocladiella emersonii ATCC 22665]
MYNAIMTVVDTLLGEVPTPPKTHAQQFDDGEPIELPAALVGSLTFEQGGPPRTARAFAAWASSNLALLPVRSGPFHDLAVRVPGRVFRDVVNERFVLVRKDGSLTYYCWLGLVENCRGGGCYDPCAKLPVPVGTASFQNDPDYADFQHLLGKDPRELMYWFLVSERAFTELYPPRHAYLALGKHVLDLERMAIRVIVQGESDLELASDMVFCLAHQLNLADGAPHAGACEETEQWSMLGSVFPDLVTVLLKRNAATTMLVRSAQNLPTSDLDAHPDLPTDLAADANGCVFVVYDDYCRSELFIYCHIPGANGRPIKFCRNSRMPAFFCACCAPPCGDLGHRKWLCPRCRSGNSSVEEIMTWNQYAMHVNVKSVLQRRIMEATAAMGATGPTIVV